jgi:hypothetical protein
VTTHPTHYSVLVAALRDEIEEAEGAEQRLVAPSIGGIGVEDIACLALDEDAAAVEVFGRIRRGAVIVAGVAACDLLGREGYP